MIQTQILKPRSIRISASTNALGSDTQNVSANFFDTLAKRCYETADRVGLKIGEALRQGALIFVGLRDPVAAVNLIDSQVSRSKSPNEIAHLWNLRRAMKPMADAFKGVCNSVKSIFSPSLKEQVEAFETGLTYLPQKNSFPPHAEKMMDEMMAYFEAIGREETLKNGEVKGMK